MKTYTFLCRLFFSDCGFETGSISRRDGETSLWTRAAAAAAAAATATTAAAATAFVRPQRRRLLLQAV